MADLAMCDTAPFLSGEQVVLRVPESHNMSSRASTSLQSSPTVLYPTSSPSLAATDFLTKRLCMCISWLSTYARIVCSLADPERKGWDLGCGRPDAARFEEPLGAGEGRGCCGKKPPGPEEEEIDGSAILGTGS